MTSLQSGGSIRRSVIHTLILITSIYRDTLRRTTTRRQKSTNTPNMRTFIHLCQFWILLLTLLINMSANSCGGAYSKAHHQCRLALPVGPQSDIFAFNLPKIWPSVKPLHVRIAQRFRRSLERSCKAPLTYVSKCPQKVLVTKLRMERWGIGTCQLSPTWRACLLKRYHSMATSLIGTCQT